MLAFDCDVNIMKITQIPNLLLNTSVTAQGMNKYLTDVVFRVNQK
jgi:hypothetical protein